MKYAFLSLGMILFGATGLGFISAFENITINNESEYYTLHDAVEASMYESFDMLYFRESNGADVKIVEEKFIANCTRRFFNGIKGSGSGYTLTFYDIMESPPKVTVVATSSTDSYTSINLGNEKGFDIKNSLSAILEYDNIFDNIKYSNPGGDCDGEELSVTMGQRYGNLCIPKGKTGYSHFVGWSTNADSCNARDIINSDSVFVGDYQNNNNKFLYACYDANTYKIKYDCQYNDNVIIIDQKYGTMYQMPSGISRAGYSLAGWYTTPKTGGRRVDSGDTFEEIGDQTLYARWTLMDYNIKFVYNWKGNMNTGDQKGSCTINSCTLDSYASKFSLPTGQKFIGWSKSPDGDVMFGDGDNIAGKISSSGTLYAKYDTDKVKITYHDGDASYVQDSCDYLSNCKLDANKFTKTGKDFDGWAKTSNGAIAYSNGDTISKISSNINLYAKWKDKIVYIIYDKNSNNTRGSMSNKECKYNVECTLDDIIITPPDGYIFKGWSFSSNGDIINNGKVKITQDTKVYAIWEKIPPKQRTITLIKGDNVKSVTGKGKYDIGSRQTVNAVVNEFYHFDGWYEGNTKVSSSQTYTFTLSKNTTLTAKASPNQIVLHYCWENSSKVVAKTGYDEKSTATPKYKRYKTTLAGVTVNSIGSGYKCDTSVKTFTYGTYSNYVIRNMGCGGGHYCIRKNDKTGDNYWKIINGSGSISAGVDNIGDSDVTKWSEFNSAFYSKLSSAQQNGFKNNSLTDIYVYPKSY